MLMCECIFFCLFIWIVMRWCVIKTWLPRSLTLWRTFSALLSSHVLIDMSISMAWFWFWFSVFSRISKCYSNNAIGICVRTELAIQNRYQWSCGVWWFHNTTTNFSLPLFLSFSFSPFTVKLCSLFFIFFCLRHFCVSHQQKFHSPISLVKLNANLPLKMYVV